MKKRLIAALGTAIVFITISTIWYSAAGVREDGTVRSIVSAWSQS